MNDAEALVHSPSITASFNLPKGVSLTFKIEQYREGCFIDYCGVGVYLNEQRVGCLSLWDAVTFRSWSYQGKDPGNLKRDIKNWGSLPLPRDPATFYERFGRALERKAQRELKG